MAKKRFSKDIILDAAFDLCKDMGLNALSMRVLAKELGCSVMPIYDSFESKEDLLTELKSYCVVETMVELESDSITDRYIKMIDYSLKYPQFFLDFVSIGRGKPVENSIVSMLYKLMRKDERLVNLSEKKLYEINSQIEIYIIGLAFLMKEAKKDKSTFIKCKEQVLQVVDAIIEQEKNKSIQ